MPTLKIIASIEVKETHKEELLTVFKNLVDASKKEEGNIAYELNQDTKNPLKFVILETWKSQDAIDFHNQTAHFQHFVGAIEGKIDNLTIDIVKPL